MSVRSSDDFGKSQIPEDPSIQEEKKVSSESGKTQKTFPQAKILAHMWTGVKASETEENSLAGHHITKATPGETRLLLGPFKFMDFNPEVDANEKAFKKERAEKKDETQQQKVQQDIKKR